MGSGKTRSPETSQPTISRILKSPAQQHYRKASIRKRKRNGKAHKIEQAIFNWVMAQYYANRAINGHMIRATAARILAHANADVPEERRLYLGFSAGLLTRFQLRWASKCHRSHGESGGVDQ